MTGAPELQSAGLNGAKNQLVPCHALSPAMLEVLAVALIWSASFVGVKVLLEHIGPLTVGGLRYSLGFLLLAPLLVRERRNLAALPPARWRRLALMGICQYTLGNAALFFALTMVKAAAGSLILTLVPVAVLLLELVWLREAPRPVQLLGLSAAVGGGVLFFSTRLEVPPPAALGALLFTLLCFTVLPILAREAARERRLRTLPLTALPLGLGGLPLLAIALVWEGLPSMPIHAWLIVGGLALVNTALAYMLYTHALVRLKASEANVILNLVPIGTALLAWLTLGEALQPIQYPAMGLVVLGVMLTQRRGRA